jgi:hypothetical protein
MLTPKQNLLELLKPQGKSDRLVNQYQPFIPVMEDPCGKFTRGNRVKGLTTKDRWGTEIAWPKEQFAAMPHVTAENKALPEITRWRDYVKVPDIVGSCSDPELWKPAFMGTGIFEQCHYLMGFEDTLSNLLEEPECMKELIAAISEFRFNYLKLLVDNLKPDVILSHDDWGSKHAMFMSPATWREIIKPYYFKMYNYAHDNGVLIMHHADSFLEPIVEDMVELGIDIWQAVLPQNDIPKIQKQLAGRMILMGGIDAAIVDWPGTPEEVIRAEVCRACVEYGPGGGFIPSLTYGLPGSIFPNVDPIITDEIACYNEKVYGIRA